MAWPPRQRRSSSSRRDRNLALVAGIAAAAVVAAGLLLLLSRREPATFALLRGAALDVVSPVWLVARAPLDAASGVVNGVGEYIGTVSTNRRLVAENRRLKRLAERNAALARENRQLKRILSTVEPTRGWSRTVAISGASAGSYVRSAVVAGGRAHGLAIGQPVRDADGLVGRIVEVGNHAARVLLLTDVNSRVPVRVVRTGRPAMVAGANAARLEVRFVAPGDAQLAVGDRLVTSGDGGLFPPDVPVAVVMAVARDLAYARPATEPSGLGYVRVERPYLPPLPAPAPVERATP